LRKKERILCLGNKVVVSYMICFRLENGTIGYIEILFNHHAKSYSSSATDSLMRFVEKGDYVEISLKGDKKDCVTNIIWEPQACSIQ
jgi:hypothetical protein